MVNKVVYDEKKLNKFISKQSKHRQSLLTYLTIGQMTPEKVLERQVKLHPEKSAANTKAWITMAENKRRDFLGIKERFSFPKQVEAPVKNQSRNTPTKKTFNLDTANQILKPLGLKIVKA